MAALTQHGQQDVRQSPGIEVVLARCDGVTCPVHTFVRLALYNIARQKETLKMITPRSVADKIDEKRSIDMGELGTIRCDIPVLRRESVTYDHR